ncbi:MAG: hypothetical protein N2C14_26640, partial [Planctomycetales bacterium]
QLKSTVTVQGEKILAVALPNPDKLLVWTEGAGIQRFALDAETVDAPEIKYPIPFGEAEGTAVPERGLIVSRGGGFMAICRGGVRVYSVEDGSLCGIVPTPPGQEVLGMGFKTNHLVIVYGAIRPPFVFRVVPVDLGIGDSDPSRVKTRPGLLYADELAGPIHFRRGKNGSYLMLGNQYVLDADSGRLTAAIPRPAPVAVPLQEGRYWTVSNKKTRIASIGEWEKMDDMFRKVQRPEQNMQFHPKLPVSVEVQVENTVLNQPAAVIERLTAALTQRLKTEGYPVVQGRNNKIVLKYKAVPSNDTIDELLFYDANGQIQGKKIEPISKGGSNIEIEFVFQGEKIWWTGMNRVSAEAICLKEPEEGISAKQAYATAVADAAGSEAGGMIFPYLYVAGIISKGQLPIKTAELK